MIERTTSAPAQLIETHISWVVLCGEFAYKIKKPVRLSFLDFSTLERRRWACEEEVRLNRRFAPDLYLGTVPIFGTDAVPTLEASGPVLEWAVKMKRFDTRLQLDRQVEAGIVTSRSIGEFGSAFAELQSLMPTAPGDKPWGRTFEIHATIRRNLAELGDLVATGDRRRIDALRRWTEAQFESVHAQLDSRRSGGFIREGHGDLHLANLTVWNGAITPFDALEFAPDLRWIDVVADIAFLVMDLERHRRFDLAHAFLDGWLERTGDWDGVRLLPYYRVYRALVRAKVNLIRARESRGAARAAAAREAAAYLRLAESTTTPPRSGLILMHGLSASGKSTLSRALCEMLPAVRVRSDVERKRLHGLGAHEASESAIGAGLYARDATARTYAHVMKAVDAILAAGGIAIADATFLDRSTRDSFFDLGRRRGVDVLILDCRAPPAVLRNRLAHRAKTAGPSEAGLEVLEWQLRVQSPLRPQERAHTMTIDTTRQRDPARFARSVRRRLRQVGTFRFVG